MPNATEFATSEEEIRTRSYLLWKNEGCQHGKSEEYWQRAKVELEVETASLVHAASMASVDGETTAFVLPVLPISHPPSKSVSERLSQKSAELKRSTS